MARGITNHAAVPITEAARLSFCRAFQYTASQQRAFEQYIQTVDLQWSGTNTAVPVFDQFHC